MVDYCGCLYLPSRTGALGLLFWCLQGFFLKSVAMGPDLMMTQPSDFPCRSGSEVYSCYDCKTNSFHEDDFCGDPFNGSHHLVNKLQCDRTHFCAKWVVRLESGAKQTVRTCSSKMNIKLRKYTVCMTESGSNSGQLCFCDGELCNAATSRWSTTTMTSLRTCATLLTAWLTCAGLTSLWTS